MRSLNRCGSYIDSPKWLKSKKAAIKPKNNDGKCFQYTVTVALNYQIIKYHPQRISKIKSFINKYDWKEMNFPSPKNDWKKIESNSKSIALNVLHVPHNTEEIRHTYISKRKNKIIILMITDGRKWHYLAVKKLSALFCRIISKHDGNFYCLNCLHLLEQKANLKNMKMYVKMMIIWLYRNA